MAAFICSLSRKVPTESPVFGAAQVSVNEAVRLAASGGSLLNSRRSSDERSLHTPLQHHAVVNQGELGAGAETSGSPRCDNERQRRQSHAYKSRGSSSRSHGAGSTSSGGGTEAPARAPPGRRRSAALAAASAAAAAPRHRSWAKERCVLCAAFGTQSWLPMKPSYRPQRRLPTPIPLPPCLPSPLLHCSGV